MANIKEYTGVIVKGIGGFYYVDTEDKRYECRARGSIRFDKKKPLVGDKVKISVDTDLMTGAVDEILERKNVFLRPPVANVTQMAVVVSATSPKPNLYLLDKVIASACFAEVDTIVCINKTDLETADEIADIYENAGFSVISMSAKENENIDVLKERLKGNITVFAGNSGVGKSSILNRIIGEEIFETGVVSEKVERGKHTTRHSELVKIDEGTYIIDTPGFGNLDMSLLNPENCADLFPEFKEYMGACKFLDCRHTVEPGCAVLEALKDNRIAKSRHESYMKLIEEVKKTDRKG